MANEIDDLAVIQTVLEGDTEAFATLVRTHQAKVRLTCVSYLLNSSEAEDAAQDVFVKAYEALSSFKKESSFATWISRIAANHCRDLLRSKKRRRTDSLDAILDQSGEHLQKLFTEPSDGQEKAYAPEDFERLAQLLASLPEDMRDVLVLREVEELSYDEIASRLQCTLDAVKGRLKRARQHLLNTYAGQSPDTFPREERLKE